MLILHNPDRYVSVSSRHTCEYHRRHPGESYAGCTCSGMWGLREATPEEYRASRLKRLRAERKELTDRLAEVYRKLNAVGANDGT